MAKIDVSGSSLVYSTYLGGSYYDQGYGVAVDTSGNAYVMGNTVSTDFPVAFPIQGSNAGGYDVFVAKIVAGPPVPDIKANGFDGPLVILQGDPLTITLNPREDAGNNADWWVWADAPAGKYWYTFLSGWVSSGTPIRVYAGPLIMLSPRAILNTSTLQVGNYSINFAVDDNMDDVFDATYTDTVDVTIE